MMSTKLLFILCICTKKGSQHKEHLSPTRQEKTQSKNTFLFQDPWFLNDDKIEKEEGKLQDPWLWNDDNIQKEEGKCDMKTCNEDKGYFKDMCERDVKHVKENCKMTCGLCTKGTKNLQ